MHLTDCAFSLLLFSFSLTPSPSPLPFPPPISLSLSLPPSPPPPPPLPSLSLSPRPFIRPLVSGRWGAAPFDGHVLPRTAVAHPRARWRRHRLGCVGAKWDADAIPKSRPSAAQPHRGVPPTGQREPAQPRGPARYVRRPTHNITPRPFPPDHFSRVSRLHAAMHTSCDVLLLAPTCVACLLLRLQPDLMPGSSLQAPPALGAAQGPHPVPTLAASDAMAARFTTLACRAPTD